MVNIGIVCYDQEQLEEIYNLIKNYVHCGARHKSYGIYEFELPLMRITVTCLNFSRGQRFDMVYYDTRFSEQAFYERIIPTCMNSRPRPLWMLLKRLK